MVGRTDPSNSDNQNGDSVNHQQIIPISPFRLLKHVLVCYRGGGGGTQGGSLEYSQQVPGYSASVTLMTG